MNSTIEFLDINDDCLFDLFEYLTIDDLCSIKQTNRRLWTLTDSYLRLNCLTKGKLVEMKYKNGASLKTILWHCGKYIRNLVIDSSTEYSDLNDLRIRDAGSGNDTYIIELVAKYCSAHLQSMRLMNLFLSGRSQSSQLRHTLTHLNVIELFRCYGDVDQLMNASENVHKIIQHDCSFFYANDQHFLSKYNYQNLHSLIIYNENETDLMPETLVEFIVDAHCALKCLHYINRFAPIPTEILPVLIEYAKNLEELCIEMEIFSPTFLNDLRFLLALNNLRRLEINTDEIAVQPFVDELSSTIDLHCFGISDVYLDERFCQSLTNLANLKVIKLVAALRTYDQFAAIISQHLAHLEEIYFIQWSNITNIDIIPFIQNSFKLKILNLFECININWTKDDHFMQFTEDFVEFYRARLQKCEHLPIDLYLDAKIMKLIDEHVWPHEFEWFTKNHVLKLRSTDAEQVCTTPGFYSRVFGR